MLGYWLQARMAKAVAGRSPQHHGSAVPLSLQPVPLQLARQAASCSCGEVRGPVTAQPQPASRLPEPLLPGGAQGPCWWTVQLAAEASPAPAFKVTAVAAPIASGLAQAVPRQ